MTGVGGHGDLGAVLGFSADELERNRAGQVSERQRGTLQKMRRGGLQWLIVMAVVAIGFGIYAGVYLIPKLNKQQHGTSKLPYGAIVYGALALVVLIIALSVFRTRRRLGRLASGTVHEVVGPAKTRVHRIAGNVGDISGGGGDYGGGIRLELTIGKTMFFIPSQEILNAFVAGATYRVFYATGGHRVYNRVLSAERLA